MQPQFFEQAQADWKRYVESHCKSTGAIGGGSSAHISERIAACREYEIDRRIELLTQIASGSYGL